MEIRIYSNGWMVGIIPGITKITISKWDFFAYNGGGFIGIFTFDSDLKYILRGK